MEPRAERLEFRGGTISSALPLLVFLVATVALIVAGAPVVEGMILAAMLGVAAGMLVVRNRSLYTDRLFSLMANRTATVAIACWLWAGAFSGILADSGLVEAITWGGWKLGLAGRAFTVVTFLAAGLFAVSVGTGLGTVLGFTAIMYPAGVLLGAHPAAVMGAIISGAAFGDNLAPVSDTTIVSAATQETDVGGVVRSRLKYVLIAFGLSTVLFLIFGKGSGSLQSDEAQRLLAETADPKGLPMLLPALLVFIVAIRGGNFIVALTLGIVAAVILGPLVGVFSLSDVFDITGDGGVEGSLVSGAMGLVPIAVLTLLLVALIGIMAEGGFLERVLDWLTQKFAHTARGIEGVILALVSLANLCVSVNTVAMITIGPFANALRKRGGIHPYRSANLLDTVSCSFPYMMPHAAVIPAAAAIQLQVAERYPFVPVVPWSEEVRYIFYGMMLFPIMVVAVITGFGRRRG